MAHFEELHVRQFGEPEGLVYKGPYIKNWWSNFEAVGAPVVYRGHSSRVLEMAFVAAKNPDAPVPSRDHPGTTVAFHERVFSSLTPGEAKRLGGRSGLVQLREDWDQVNLAAMDCFERQRWRVGAPGLDRLMATPEILVEWNNWRDDRWGATVAGRKGRNAFGLLLACIKEEHRAGCLESGAEERFWPERQGELVERLNGMWPETLFAKASPAKPSQMSMF